MCARDVVLLRGSQELTPQDDDITNGAISLTAATIIQSLARFVIARSVATKQSILSFHGAMDCFAEPVIGRRFAPTRWLAMTSFRGSAWGLEQQP
jgi:hypothetical protein